MRAKVVLGTIGTILKFFSFAFLVPILPALYFWEDVQHIAFVEVSFSAAVFGLCAAVTLLAGLLLETFGSKKDFTDKEGFAIVSGGWLTIALFASLPFLLTGSIGTLPGAYFEAMSGLTTTGATVLPFPLEQYSQAVLFWRALLQWMGGMGIIVLSVAVLTRLTEGGKKLIESEAPGPSLHKLKPTIMQTAKLLWMVYLFFTIAEILALRLVGVPVYEAIYHAFTTLSTGGFSPHTASISHYGAIVHWIIMLFMIIAGANFTLHYYAIHGKKGTYRRDAEFRFYLGMVAVVVSLVALDLVASGHAAELGIRQSAFQSISILTTTGFTTANYDVWSGFARFLLFLLMFVGGCAGSTSGAIKQVRLLLLFKMLRKKLHKLLHPRAVIPVRLGGKLIPEKSLHTITMFFFAYILVFIISTAGMLALGMDMVSGSSAVAACLGNVGPALGSVGPNYSYAPLPELAKIWLSVCMWLGRLEIFTALILFVPTAYKREAFLE